MVIPALHTRRRNINQDDPRVKRTLKLLGDTLLELIVEKGYDDVSIQHITDRANVSRTTFYLHFKDKDELLFASMRAMYDDLVASTHNIDFRNVAAAEAAMCDPADFEHVQKYIQFYRVMLSKNGSMAFLLSVLDYLAATMLAALQQGKPEGAQPNIPLPILAHIMAGSEIGVMTWWVKNGTTQTPAQMAQFLYDAHSKGIWWALGIEKT